MRMPLRLLSLCLALTFLNNPALLAEEKSAEIEEIVVSTLRLKTSLKQSGASVSIIDEALIRSRGQSFLADSIASATGVTLNQNGPFGGQASIRIRGASSDQTLVLIDGVPANDTTSPGGGFNFGAIDAVDVQRVEILKGPQSTLWGTDAIGGVINIVSRPAEETFNANFSAEAGSFGTYRIATNASGANEVGDLRISYSDIETDGISKADEVDGNTEEDGFDAETLSIKGGLNLGSAARLEISYRDTDARTEFDGFGPATGVEDSDEVSETNHRSAQAKLSFGLFEDRLENVVTYGRTEIERENFSSGVTSFSAEGERSLLRYQGTVNFSDSHLLSIGYEAEDSESGNNDSSIDGAFALYKLHASDDVTLSFGLRRDDHEVFGSETVGRIATAWQVSDTMLLHASWGEGFKAPTIFQTTFFCCGATSANAELKPEFSEAFDLGIEYRFAEGNGTVGATYFNQDTTDLINFSFAVGGYENIAEVDTEGVELELAYNLNETWSIEANLTYLDSEDGTGSEQIRLPEKTADLMINWHPSSAIQASLMAVYNGEEGDRRGTVDSWTRVDLAGSYHLNEHVEFFARIENLIDSDYQQIFGYGTPERSGYFGARFSF
ncbi:MAG: TonB-dependent receptor [Gammaproteobacteria bacterium]|jgi:vitamin B12 transporter|nr:TonB-dependent receptor [Gammaproteobacteria bacterium]MBT4491775.1 TonB-dependent receptor [Gammaproteobacteria bacterium]MBT7370286.1 TonB-dependent receptor [Gammaproteobacteria bacterium]